MECITGTRYALYKPDHVLQLSSSQRFMNMRPDEFKGELTENVIQSSLPFRPSALIHSMSGLKEREKSQIGRLSKKLKTKQTFRGGGR